MDLDAAVLYQPAFALADQLREADSQNHPGRWRSNPAAGGSVETIIAEMLRRLAVTDEAGREIVREACDDVARGGERSSSRGDARVDPDAPVGVRGRRSPARNPPEEAHAALRASSPNIRMPSTGAVRAGLVRSIGDPAN